jgi:hypothetical protein
MALLTGALPQPEYTIEQQIACVVRELAFRERVYPRWVADKKMTQKVADYQLSCMRSVLYTLERLKDGGY